VRKSRAAKAELSMSPVTSNLNARRSDRPHLLMTAYHYDRAHSMESRLSWQRAQHAAEDFDVTVICARRGGRRRRPRDGRRVARQQS
jgi:hypothetical protein